jgi:hypothetical protein
MKQSERFALMEWLSEFPDDKTYDEIIEMLNVDDWIDPDISVWEVVENYELSEVADMIENTRMHFESITSGLTSALASAIRLAQDNAPDTYINNFGVEDDDFTERLNALQGVLAEWEVL